MNPALATAKRLAERHGGEGGSVGVHSFRVLVLTADDAVILGLPGKTRTIAHQTTSREAYVPGVLLAIRRVSSKARFCGLDELLGLD